MRCVGRCPNGPARDAGLSARCTSLTQGMKGEPATSSASDRIVGHRTVLVEEWNGIQEPAGFDRFERESGRIFLQRHDLAVPSVANRAVRHEEPDRAGIQHMARGAAGVARNRRAVQPVAPYAGAVRQRARRPAHARISVAVLVRQSVDRAGQAVFRVHAAWPSYRRLRGLLSRGRRGFRAHQRDADPELGALPR